MSQRIRCQFGSDELVPALWVGMDLWSQCSPGAAVRPLGSIPSAARTAARAATSRALSDTARGVSDQERRVAARAVELAVAAPCFGPSAGYAPADAAWPRHTRCRWPLKARGAVHRPLTHPMHQTIQLWGWSEKCAVGGPLDSR